MMMAYTMTCPTVLRCKSCAHLLLALIDECKHRGADAAVKSRITFSVCTLLFGTSLAIINVVSRVPESLSILCKRRELLLPSCPLRCASTIG